MMYFAGWSKRRIGGLEEHDQTDGAGDGGWGVDVVTGREAK